MTRWLSRTWFRIRMMRFRRAPKNLRHASGQFRSLREWRLEQMRGARG